MIWDRTSVPACAVTLIQRFEGWSATPYKDSSGYWTIGWGSRFMPDGAPVTAASRALTRTEGDALLRAQIGTWLKDIDATVQAPIHEYQAAALVSFVHNLGIGNLRSSTLLEMLMAGRADLAAGQFHQFCMTRDPNTKQLVPVLGLERRRYIERQVFSGMDPDAAYKEGYAVSQAEFDVLRKQAIASAASWHAPSPPKPVPAAQPLYEISADELNARFLAQLKAA